LIIDDNKDFCSLLVKVLEKRGCESLCLNDTTNIISKATNFNPDIILLDVMLPTKSGIAVLEEIKKAGVSAPVLMISNREDAKLVVSAMKAGASDYIPKTADNDELWEKIKKLAEMQQLRTADSELKNFSNIIGESESTKSMMKMISKVTQTDAPVFLRGESGTGKSLIAETIHSHSNRKHRPFMTINCPSIPQNLLESEFFGHEKGSFTGAIKTKEGKFEIADGGTVFLDEIAELTMDLQVKILRVIQNKEFERVGGLKTIKTDVRIIAATNKDVEKAVKEGAFREDLYYRLNVLPIYVPSLRERKDDIPLLAKYFFELHEKKEGKKFNPLSNEIMEMLQRYPWPGNIRELENVIERAIILGKEPNIRPSDFSEDLNQKVFINNITTDNKGDAKKSDGPLSLKDMEYEGLVAALQSSSGNISKAAKLLNVSRDTLYRRMKKHGIELK
jgi:two-component system NtrC family response regulator